MKTFKKSLAVVMALMMLLSFASLAFATYKPTLELVNKEIVVTNTNRESYYYELNTKAGEEGITSGYTDTLMRKFGGLTEGNTYTVTAYTNTGTAESPVKGAEVAVSDPITLKKPQESPTNKLIIVSVTAETITVKYVEGCQVKLDDGEWKEFTKDTNYVFEGLVSETSYDIYLRKSETDEKYASPAVSLPVKTLKAAPSDVPSKPRLKDMTSTSITVENEDGYTYSIDGGKTYQESNVFTGLEAGKAYSVIRRIEAAGQEPSKSSEASIWTIPSRAAVKAKKESCLVSVSTGLREGDTCKVTANTVLPELKKGQTNEYGDTKLVPMYITINGGSQTYFSGSNSLQFQVNVKGTYSIEVCYREYKYTGGQGPKGTDYEVVGSDYIITKSVTVDRAQSAIEKFLEPILNFFLDTLPAYISKGLHTVVEFIKKFI